DEILAGNVARLLRLAGELWGRQVDVLLVQLDRDLALRITGLGKREATRAVPFVVVGVRATADRAANAVEVLQDTRDGALHIAVPRREAAASPTPQPDGRVPDVQQSTPPARRRRPVIPRFLVCRAPHHPANVSPADLMEEPPEAPLDRYELRQRAGEDVPLRD